MRSAPPAPSFTLASEFTPLPNGGVVRVFPQFSVVLVVYLHKKKVLSLHLKLFKILSSLAYLFIFLLRKDTYMLKGMYLRQSKGKHAAGKGPLGINAFGAGG